MNQKRITDARYVNKIAETTYCFIIFAYYGFNAVLQYELQVTTMITSLPIYILLGYKIIMTRYTHREFIMGVVFAALAVLSYVSTRDITLFTNVLVLFSLKNINIDKLLKALFWSASAGCLLVVLCSLTGSELAISLTKDYGRGGVETRYCFGFLHPNQFHMYMCRLMCLFVGAYYSRINWKYLVGLFVVNLVLYRLSVSRTGLLCCILLIVLAGIYKYGEKFVFSNGWKILINVGFCVVIAFGVLSVILYDKIPLLTYANRLFTGRIRLSWQALRETGLSLFGRQIPGDIVCDNGLVYLLLTYGVILFVIYIGAMFILLLKAQKIKSSYVIILLMVFITYSLMEALALPKVFRNVPMMYMSWLIFKSNYPDGDGGVFINERK